MNKNAIFFIILSVLAGLNLGTVRKTEDPIRDTQTNPILYKQKMEEEKDGKKGPLMYHVKNNPRESFFIDPPYDAEEKKSSGGTVAGEAPPAPADTAGWWEEQPSGAQAESPAEVGAEPLPGSPSEAGTEPLPESLPEEEKARDLEPAESAAPETDAGDAPADKSSDSWW
jgi:hypothetical protein